MKALQVITQGSISREPLDNPARLRDNELVIASQDWPRPFVWCKKPRPDCRDLRVNRVE